MSIPFFKVGQRPQIATAFTSDLVGAARNVTLISGLIIPNVQGALADPAAITFRLRNATGLTIQTYGDGVVLKDSTGLYYVNYQCTVLGDHFVTWEATSGLIAISELQFTVGPIST